MSTYYWQVDVGEFNRVIYCRTKRIASLIAKMGDGLIREGLRPSRVTKRRR